MSDNDPTNCDRCKAALDGGWSERWRDDKRIEVVCLNCNRAERRAAYETTGILTSSIMTDAAIYSVRREYDEAQDPLLDRASREVAQIRKACKSFERDVWFAGLQTKVRAASHRGFRAPFTVGAIPCVALVWSCAGRTVFTLEPEDESYQVTLITAEDEASPVMGIHGVCSTKEQAVGLIDAATKALRGGVGFKRDDKVGMF